MATAEIGTLPRERVVNMTDQTSRRDFLKTSDLGAGSYRRRRLARWRPPRPGLPRQPLPLPISPSGLPLTKSVTPLSRPSTGSILPRKPRLTPIRIDPSKTYQDILGFGAAFTDGACYTLNRMDPPAGRDRLLHELYHPSEMGLSIGRTCIGASDCSTTGVRLRRRRSRSRHEAVFHRS
jgi:hypothetical protein